MPAGWYFRPDPSPVGEEYAATPEYIVELAKTKLGLVNENEIIFKERKPEE